MTEPSRSPPDAGRRWHGWVGQRWRGWVLTWLRVLVGVWCVLWLLVLLIVGAFALDACDDTAPATCERAINTASLVVIAAQLVALVVALVFSNPGRPSRTQAMALTLGVVAPVVLLGVLYLVAYYVS